MPLSSATIDCSGLVELVPVHQTSILSPASLSFGWKAAIRRTVPERERIRSTRSRPRRAGTYAAQERAAGDAGRRDEDVVPRNQIVGVKHVLEVEAASSSAWRSSSLRGHRLAPGSPRPCT